MRIGLTCSTFEPQLTQGKIDGIGMYAKTLFDEYVKLQLEVKPLSFPTFKHRIRTSQLPNGTVLPLPYTAATVASLIKPVASFLYRNLNHHMDLVHSTDHMIPRVTHLPVIATIHDALMFKHPEWYQSKLRGIKNALRKETMKWANHFITISHAMIPELEEFLGINAEKISVVYNGLETGWQKELSAEIKKNVLTQFNLPNTFILFTGTLQPKKNIVRLITAFLALPEDIRHQYPLVIVGKSGWDDKEIMAAIHKLTTQRAGFWLNYVNHEEIQALYQSATLYVFPSLHEGFGRTLLEAFASKTPVIASTIPALQEIAGNAACLIDPMSITDLTEAMQKILTSEIKQNALREKGYERAKEFTLEKCARDTLDVYKKVL
jgi:glycosyltransferase involved in cell wall biosynthesis